MNELALFAGAGGGILGGHLLGWRTVCAVERDAYAAQVLAQRQNDRILKPFPIWSDVCSFDGKPWRGIVDVVSGGFPCQDISVAGKGAGIAGARSGMWSEMARIVREVEPKFVYVENSPILTSRGLGVVLGDLAAMGFNAEWGVVSAADTGASHIRERIWIVAYSNGVRESQYARVISYKRMGSVKCGEILANSECSRARGEAKAGFSSCINQGCSRMEEGESGPRQEGDRTFNPRDFPPEPSVGRVANGVAFGMDRLKTLGNGQVPRVAATAFHILSEKQ